MREQNKAAAVDAGAADAAGERLHVEVGKFAAAACGDPGAIRRSGQIANKPILGWLQVEHESVILRRERGI
ncbi:hypothetical protein D7M10_18050 [Pseudomonas fluorescens]|nr:hypothetical protein D7M10_18050 [Pseudomonas fluorescens]